MSEQKQILKVSKDSLLAVVSSIIPVSETVTWFFRKLQESDVKKTLLVDEKDQAKVLGIRGVYKDITTEADMFAPVVITDDKAETSAETSPDYPFNLRFNISSIAKWIDTISGNVLVSTNGINITFALIDPESGDVIDEFTSPLIQEVEREPKIALMQFPAYFKVKYEDLESAKSKITSVGETLEIDVGETIRLSCSREGQNVRHTLKVSEKSFDPTQHGKYQFSYPLFELALKGLLSYPEVKLNFGQKDGKPFPLILEASNATTEIKYGISPRV